MLEGGDFLRRQLAGRGHLQVGFLVAYRFDEQALLRFAGHQRTAAFAAGLPAAARVEPQAAFLFLLAVTLRAMLRQQRPHVRFEKGQIVGFDRRVGRASGRWFLRVSSQRADPSDRKR